MNRRFLSVILFALVVSAIASFGLYKAVVSRMTPTMAADRVQLVGAARDLPQGTLLKASDFKMVDWGGPVPSQAIYKQEDAIGRGVTVPTISLYWSCQETWLASISVMIFSFATREIGVDSIRASAAATRIPHAVAIAEDA